MIRSLWTGATGMEAQQRNVDVIANNIANVNTTSFKKSQALFQDLLYQKIKSAGSAINQEFDNPTGVEVGHGVTNVATRRVFTQGELQLTDQPLDITILGDGFFQVVLPHGFMENPHVPRGLRMARHKGLELDMADVSYFLGRERLYATNRPGMAIWREKLFATMSRNSTNAADFFQLPPSQVVELGTLVEL